MGADLWLRYKHIGSTDILLSISLWKEIITTWSDSWLKNGAGLKSGRPGGLTPFDKAKDDNNVSIKKYLQATLAAS